MCVCACAYSRVLDLCVCITEEIQLIKVKLTKHFLDGSGRRLLDFSEILEIRGISYSA